MWLDPVDRKNRPQVRYARAYRICRSAWDLLERRGRGESSLPGSAATARDPLVNSITITNSVPLRMTEGRSSPRQAGEGQEIDGHEDNSKSGRNRASAHRRRPRLHLAQRRARRPHPPRGRRRCRGQSRQHLPLLRLEDESCCAPRSIVDSKRWSNLCWPTGGAPPSSSGGFSPSGRPIRVRTANCAPCSSSTGNETVDPMPRYEAALSRRHAMAATPRVSFATMRLVPLLLLVVIGLLLDRSGARSR